jgi:hypothetical protein
VWFFIGNKLKVSKMKRNHKIQRLKCAKPASFSKWINFGIVFLFVININSCNFPEDLGTERMLNTPFVYHFETGSTGGTVSYNIGEELRYQVVLAPKWMDIKTIGGRTVNGEMNIQFQFNAVRDYMEQGDYLSGALIVRMGNIGLFSFTVSYGVNPETNPDPNPIQPFLICSAAYLNFGAENNLSFTLTNPGSYNNSWYATDIPSWLQLSESSGDISGGNQITIQCTIIREGLQPGDYSQQINIESTNPRLSTGILVTMKVDNAGPIVNQTNIKWIEGKVKDSYFCKTTNYLYVLTQNPNRLLYKLPDSDSLYIVPLSKLPNCIDVSKDGKTLAIGYNQAVVDLLDAQTFELKRSYETECVPFDIVFGENDWCYIAPDLDQWVQLHSLNLTTGVTFRAGTHAAMYQKTILVKVSDKPLLYATRTGLSPGGVLAVNIADGAAKDTIPTWHVDTGPAIWLTPDNKKLISAYKKIFKAPDYTTNLFTLDLPIVGSIDIPQSLIKTLDFCESLNSYFVVGTDYFWAAYNSETIYQLNAESYSTTKSVKVKSFPGYLSNSYNPLMDVHYIFANKQGTKLFALKNVKYDLEMDKWALEIIDLPLK